MPGFEYTGWFALMTPAGTPQPIVDRLLADLKTAVEQPGMKRYFEEQGMSAAVKPPGPLKGGDRAGVGSLAGAGPEKADHGELKRRAPS